MSLILKKNNINTKINIACRCSRNVRKNDSGAIRSYEDSVTSPVFALQKPWSHRRPGCHSQEGVPNSSVQGERGSDGQDIPLRSHAIHQLRDIQKGKVLFLL